MNEISTKKLKKMMDSGEKYVLLDCRGVDYYNWEHISTAVNLRWKYVEERADSILKDKNSLIITSCEGFTCSVSIRCYERLQKLGYTNLFEYSGGIADWKAHGFKTDEISEFKIASNIYRFPNQIFAGEQVGSYLIDEKDFILLVDGPQQLGEEHEDFILHFDKPIKIFMTHDPTAGEAEDLQRKYKATIYLHKKDKNGEWLTVKPDKYITDEYQFTKNLRVIHTPGHTPGSSVLLDTNNKVVFSGDAIGGNKNGDINKLSGPRADTSQMLQSIKKLIKYEFNQILPFHYEMIRNNAKEKLEKFIST